MADLASTLLGKAKYTKVVSLLFNIRTNAHIAHLQSTSFSAHKALNTLYEDILEVADRFAESAQKDGILNGYTLGELYSGNFITFLESKYNEIIECRKSITETHLLQILDDGQEIISSTIYKLKFLK